MTDQIQQKRGIRNHKTGQQKMSRLKENKKYGKYKKQLEKHVRHILLAYVQLKSQKNKRQRIIAEAIYKEIMTKNHFKMMEYIQLKIQESLQLQRWIDRQIDRQMKDRCIYSYIHTYIDITHGCTGTL